jgi:signal peptidase II
MKPWILKSIILGASIITLDRLLKVIAFSESDFFIFGHFVRFTFVKNTGIALSIPFPNSVSVLFSIFFLGMLLVMIILQRMSNADLASISAIFAGGLSNLFDRVVYGYVIDYVSITVFKRIIIFNFADLAVVTGAVFLIFWQIYYGKRNKSKNL